ncbi:hypothetical protein U9M48_017479 [Paspalum notatum var. saurae]|uniref:Phytocyanin domain-containing protein n=1 Tax=Paspalum notatum var. saurae TaxID=547442 RepID=A0AAQ3T8W2_PASNO
MPEMKTLVCVAVALSLMINVATAADYVVGNPAGGWDGRTDYKNWAASQTFAPGDTLTFKYNSYHSVLEVTKDAFEACTTTDPISYDDSGSTTIALTMPGTHYFICGAPGHCLAGMKMEVEVADRPAPITPSSPPPMPPPAPEKRRHAMAPMLPSRPAPMPWAPAPRSWSPAPAPAAATPRRAGHKKHRKRYCPPETVHAPARPPVVQAVEDAFPFAAFAPMSSPPPTSDGPAVLRAMWGQATAMLAILCCFMLLAP